LVGSGNVLNLGSGHFNDYFAHLKGTKPGYNEQNHTKILTFYHFKQIKAC